MAHSTVLVRAVARAARPYLCVVSHDAGSMATATAVAVTSAAFATAVFVTMAMFVTVPAATAFVIV